MKKVFLVVAMALGLMASAFAENQDMLVDGKLIRLTNEVGTAGADRVFHTKDMPGGVYILTSANGPASQDNLPGAAALIRSIFIARGVKIADKPEDAGIAITFDMGGSATLVAANTKAEHSSLPSTGKVMSSVGAIAAGMAQGGIYAAVGYLAGGLIETDERTYLSAFIMDKPVVREVGLFTKHPRVVPTEDKMSSLTSNNVHITYRLEKGKEATDDAILKLMADQWINKFIVVDTSPAGASPASAVSVAETTEQKN